MIAIYKIENNVNNEVYIGGTNNFQRRCWEHKHALRHNKHKSKSMQQLWNLIGEENFTFSIIEKVDNKTIIIEREQYWLDTLKPYYNNSPTAGKNVGVIHTDESKRNMSLAHLGKKLTKESIEKRTKKQKGLKRSPQTVERLKNTSCCKPVLQISLDNQLIKIWRSASEASRELKIVNITPCCRGERKVAGGYKWKYKN